MKLSPKTAERFVGMRVRVSALGGRGGGHTHFMRAMLKAVTKKKALVQPTGHGRPVWVPLGTVYSWKGGNT